MDRSCRLTKDIPTAKKMAKRTANIVLEYWVASVRIPSKALTDDGPQFTSNLIAALYKELGNKTITTTEYYLQANGQVEPSNATMVSRIRHCVEEHQNHWDTFMFLLTYAYNVQVPQTKMLSPFSLETTRFLPRRTAKTRPLPPDVSKIASPLACRLRLIHRTALLGKMAEKNYKKAQAG